MERKEEKKENRDLQPWNEKKRKKETGVCNLFLIHDYKYLKLIDKRLGNTVCLKNNRLTDLLFQYLEIILFQNITFYS